jgi:hypothetical protein
MRRSTWRLLKFLPIGALVPMIYFAAQIPPEDAASNVSKWMQWLGISGVPSALKSSAADHQFIVGALGGAFIYSALVWVVPAWRKWRRGPFCYFRLDILDPENLTADNPISIVNDGDIPFHNVDSWFSPVSAKRKPDPLGNPYWSLRHLKIVWTPLHKGGFRTGKMLPPGAYFIEYNAIYEGLSFGFVERLELRKFDGKLIQLIDVYDSSGEKIYSSPRARQFAIKGIPWE